MGREWLVLLDKEKARDHSEWRLADIWHCVIITTVVIVIIIIVLRASLTLALNPWWLRW